jgi:hypothetical protein
MRGAWVVLTPILLGGCLPPAVTVVSLAADGVSYAANGKSVTDNGMSVVKQQDCAGWHFFVGRAICEDPKHPVAAAPFEQHDGGSAVAMAAPPAAAAMPSAAPAAAPADVVAAAVPPAADAAPPVAPAAAPTDVVAAAGPPSTAAAPPVTPAAAPTSVVAAVVPPAAAAAPPAAPAAAPAELVAAAVPPAAAAAPSATPAAASIVGRYLLIGSFLARGNAERLAAAYPQYRPRILRVHQNGSEFYRVVLGPLEEGDVSALRERGVPGTILSPAEATPPLVEASLAR